MSTEITKENSIPILVNSVRLGQKNGAYFLKECALLNKAIQYFNSDVKEKPFADAQEPEVVAINLLLQGVQKAQMHGGEHSYSLEDAALLSEILDFWVKEGGKQVGQNIGKTGKSAKSGKTPSARSIKKSEVDSDTDEDEYQINPVKQ